MDQYITVDTDGVATLDETRMLAKCGVPVVSSQKELLAEENNLEDELSVQLGITGEREIKAITKDGNHPAVYEDFNEIDYEDDEPEESVKSGISKEPQEEATVKKHLTEHLTEAGIKYKSQEEAIQKMVQVIEDNIGYTMSQNESQDLINKREENRAKGRKRRQVVRGIKRENSTRTIREQAEKRQSTKSRKTS